MNTHFHRSGRLPGLTCLALAWLFLIVPVASAQETTFLGPAPYLANEERVQEVRLPYAPGVRAVSFNPFNRQEVASAYLDIYLPQQSIQPGWNGSVAACNAGNTTTPYRQATIDRVNYYRAHAGLSGNVTLFGGTQATGTQQAALMFSANESLSHTPPDDWLCWTQPGATAAGKSNIALGHGSNQAAGPSAVDLYMDDWGSSNHIVGHRRWILYPPQIQMESGSIPFNPQWAANALWVLGPFGSYPPVIPAGVAWPPRGYVPWHVLPRASNRWSLSLRNANFATARVSMKRDGVVLPAPVYEPIQSGYGDNTLVWRPAGVTYSQPVADVTYNVTITGITGSGVPSTITYDVIVIDPTASGPDPNQPPTILAPASIRVTEDVSSSLAGIAFADPDAGTGSLTATFSVPRGTLQAASGSGVSVSGTATTRVLNGSLAALNAFIAANKLRYTTARDDTANLSLSVTINDNGHTGSGGPKTATRNVTLTVTAVNDPPSVSAPARLPVYAAGIAPISGVSFADVDAGAGSLTVSLSAPSSVTLSGASNLGVTASGSGSSRTFDGTLSALNNYFAAGMARMTGPGFTGTGNLTISINDNGHTGSGGAKTVTVTVTLYPALFADGFE